MVAASKVGQRTGQGSGALVVVPVSNLTSMCAAAIGIGLNLFRLRITIGLHRPETKVWQLSCIHDST